MRTPWSTTSNSYIVKLLYFIRQYTHHRNIDFPKKKTFFTQYAQVAWQHKRRRRDATGYKDSWRLQITDANLIIQFTIKHKKNTKKT